MIYKVQTKFTYYTGIWEWQCDCCGEWIQQDTHCPYGITLDNYDDFELGMLSYRTLIAKNPLILIKSPDNSEDLAFGYYPK